MKNLLKLTQILCLTLMLTACASDLDFNDSLQEVTHSQLSEPCVNQDPAARVINNSTEAFDLLVLDTEGTVLVEMLSIQANTTTSWASFPEGDITFSLNSNVSTTDDIAVVLKMGTCMVYDIEIDINNQIVSNTPTRL
ncbi:hypothetical protein [Winogradskyella sp.]|uniref:hypothetical protein n=1 Tax=Winogradskyella sp. TaxID=1883156 RepID=UPI0026262C3E|nr:hypothetical protein [Winogradskyella sp.]